MCLESKSTWTIQMFWFETSFMSFGLDLCIISNQLFINKKSTVQSIPGMIISHHARWTIKWNYNKHLWLNMLFLEKGGGRDNSADQHRSQ